MTTKEMLEKVIENENVPEDVKAKAREVIASIDKKNAKRAEKSAENKTGNLATAHEIAELMAGGRWYAVSEIVEELIPDTTHSKSKISNIMSLGADNGIFEVDKEYKVGGKGRKVNGYRLATEQTTEDETTEDETTEDETTE